VERKPKSSKNIATCAMLTSLAMIFTYVEALIPINIGIPGVKLGLANIVIVIALYILPVYQVYCIQTARIVLVSLLFGNMSTMLYSLAGGLLSLSVMAILKKTNLFSITAISLVGGVTHNIGQLIVAIIVVKNLNIALYTPILMIAGVITGCIIGLLSYKILQILKKVEHD
jgi:heptaprenyl diphosphate synthase